MAVTGLRADVCSLEVTLGRHTILSDVTLSVLPGECVAILGASGCGKSTLLRALIGRVPLTNGFVEIGGQQVTGADSVLGQVGFVPQDDVVIAELTVQRALTYAARLRASVSHQPVEELLARVEAVIVELGLEERRGVRINRLSGGQRKRVSIALELLGQPGLLILDEPTSGLDIALENQFMKLLGSLAQAGQTILLTTHILQSLTYVNLVAILAQGRLAYYGPPGEMLDWFEVKEARDIYELTLSQSEYWASRYLSSVQHYQYVEARLKALL